MKKLSRILLALATLCSLRACAGLDTMLSGKEVSVSYKDGVPVVTVGIK